MATKPQSLRTKSSLQLRWLPFHEAVGVVEAAGVEEAEEGEDIEAGEA